MNKELELKYIINKNEVDLHEKIINLLANNGFEIKDKSQVVNSDHYYDTKDLNLYLQGGSLRIRRALSKTDLNIFGTYKMPTKYNEVYSSRIEIEKRLIDGNFINLKKELPIDFNNIVSDPVISSTTRRTNVILKQNKNELCLSFDNSVYTNHIINQQMVSDQMIEIEIIKSEDKNILNKVDNILSKEENLSINKQSKYERAINKTFALYNEKVIENKKMK